MNPIASALSGVRLGEPQTFRNLTIFPLLGERADTGVADYLLLDEALERDLAEVTEISQMGSVPTLAFENKSDLPVLLVEGDELRGAKQNRILNLTIFVGPRVKIEIPVSCVERGRWRHTTDRFASGAAGSGGLGYGKLRAMNNAFVSASLSADGSAIGNQGGVWNGIEGKFAATHTSSDTRSMSDVYEQKAKDVSAYEAAFRSVPLQRGAVVFVDGKPAGLELFDAERAFDRFLKKLVRSYALDAIEDEKTPTALEPSRDQALKFIADSATAPRENFSTVGEGESVRWRSSGIAGGARVVGDKAIHVASFATEGL